jgi:UDP-N-acetylmuramate dehydrogenase
VTCSPSDDAVAVALQVLSPLRAGVVPGGALGPLTTYRVGGPAAVRVTLAGEDDLPVVAAAAAESGLPVLVVGRGSNLLVSDSGFGGIAVVVGPPGFARVDIDPPRVRAGAAVALPALARQSVEAGLSGLEWAVGVPGSVGGGVRMNAGGHGSDMAASLRSARVYDLRASLEAVMERSDLQYRYRHSAVGAAQVVVEAEFQLAPGDPQAGRETIRQIVRWRREHQPGGQNAGSVFTNPPGDSAGRLIDAAGLKGLRLRTAMVSEKHANFIQADPAGQADDVFALLSTVRREVQARLGVDLHHEVRLVGFPPQPSTSSSDFPALEGENP